MTSRRRHLKVFLCHASGDKPQVRALYDRLIADGVDAWLDQENLLPGQDWREEIPKTVREADAVVICLSNKSITKEGYIQKEIKFALDAAEEKPIGSIFLIPARLEECMVPEQLSRWQWVDLFSEGGYEKLIMSLQSRARNVDETITLPKLKAPRGEPKKPRVENKSPEKALEEEGKTKEIIKAGRVTPGERVGDKPNASEEDKTSHHVRPRSRSTETREGPLRPRRKLSVEIQVALVVAAATIIAAFIGIGPAILEFFQGTSVIPSATPFCMSSEDILVKVHVLRSNNTEIATLTPSATFYIEPGLTVYFQVELISVNGIDLPSPECSWKNTGTATDAKLLHNTGCRIDYQGGLKNITDSISLQLSQPSCLALPPYAFFIASQQ